ncbi:unnamed protein product [Linum tenue]|uniref:Uncharacterized protein n=1 Tax=Linum tenue TaxID=586396 RepID=A0AAV0KM83_9ROSI|nr:unnamed protein product [Linum tenue]
MEDDNTKEKKNLEDQVRLPPPPPAALLLGNAASDAADNQINTDSPANSRKQGGLITMPFIIANEAFEKVASYGLAPNMIMYLMKDYKMGVAKGTNILFLWSAATNFTPLFGAFMSDSFLGRFLTIGLASLSSLLGTILLWLTPPQCPTTATLSLCSTTPTAGQLTLLFSSLALISIGAGGIRPCSLAFGADQVDNRANPAKNKRILETFFGWYYASTALSVLIALTAIVYIQDHLGWRVGFGVPAILMLLSALFFFVASPLYVKHKASTRTAKYPWNLCTVQQVEELKALIKVFPIWSSGIMLSINTSQTSFPVIQASSMDRHLTSGFKIPAASYSMFLVVTIIIWVVFYDRAILPLASKLRGRPVKLSTKLRMGLGLVVSCLSMVVAASVEGARRKKAIEEGVVSMSAMWLVPQYVLLGLAESLNAIGQIEFYYSEFPKTMSSIASCLFGLGMGVASLLASVVLSIVNRVTSRGGKDGWINDNINRARYDNYYYLLAVMGAINLVYFGVCSWSYGACEEDMTRKVGNNEENGVEMGNGRSNGLEGKDHEQVIR